MRAGDRAWIALGLGILAYDVLCADGETLSEAADRYMVSHKWWTRSVGFAIVFHVCNMIDDRYDPIHWLFLIKDRAIRGAGMVSTAA